MNIPKPRNPQAALRQARVWERANAIAEQLKHGGQYYCYRRDDGVWDMYKRSYDATPDTSYTIDFRSGVPTCSCPDFEKHADFCKHSLAMEIYFEELAGSAQGDLFLEEERNAECATGTDPFAEF